MDENKKEESKVKCAHCGKYINMHVRKCPYCGIHFRGEAFQFKHKTEQDYFASKNKPIKILALIILILIIIGLLILFFV